MSAAHDGVSPLLSIPESRSWHPGDGLKVVSLVPAATSAVARLGYVATLVGRSQACQWPASVCEVPSIAADPGLDGNGLVIHATALLTLAPDVVFVPHGCRVKAKDAETAAAVNSLRRVVLPGANDVQSGLALFGRVAKPLGAGDPAVSLVRAAKQRVSSIQAMASLHDKVPQRPKVAVIQGVVELRGCGHWVPEAIEMVGGVCVGGMHGKPPPAMTKECLAEADVIVIGGSGGSPAVDELRESGNLAWIKAMAPGRVYVPLDKWSEAAVALSGLGSPGGMGVVAVMEAVLEAMSPTLLGAYGHIVHVDTALSYLAPPSRGVSSMPSLHPLSRSGTEISHGKASPLPHDTSPSLDAMGTPTPHRTSPVHVRRHTATAATQTSQRGTPPSPPSEGSTPAPLPRRDEACHQSPRRVVEEQIRRLASKDYDGAFAMYSDESQREMVTADHLASLGALDALHPSSHITVGGCSVHGRYAQEGCLVRIPVTTAGRIFVWDIRRQGGRWVTELIATRSG